MFDLNYRRGLPYALREWIALNHTSFYELKDSWSTKGAREFPFGVVILNKTTSGKPARQFEPGG